MKYIIKKRKVLKKLEQVKLKSSKEHEELGVFREVNR